jgi:hypothetical protein
MKIGKERSNAKQTDEKKKKILLSKYKNIAANIKGFDSRYQKQNNKKLKKKIL